MSAEKQLSVSDVIDNGPISPLQVTAILLCSLVAFLDGVDSQSIAVGVPMIVGEFNLPRTVIGIILSSALLGAMVGAMTFGLLGDQFGRKRMLLIATTMFGVFTLATAYATSYTTLLAIRFGAGLGLGGSNAAVSRVGVRIRSEAPPSHGGQPDLGRLSGGCDDRRVHQFVYSARRRLAHDVHSRRGRSALRRFGSSGLASRIDPLPCRRKPGPNRGRTHHGADRPVRLQG